MESLRIIQSKNSCNFSRIIYTRLYSSNLKLMKLFTKYYDWKSNFRTLLTYIDLKFKHQSIPPIALNGDFPLSEIVKFIFIHCWYWKQFKTRDKTLLSTLYNVHYDWNLFFDLSQSTLSLLKIFRNKINIFFIQRDGKSANF